MGGAPGRVPLDFSAFDTRGYRTVDVRTGYAEWVPTYEDTVQDAMDIALLDDLRSVEWAGRAADLGCGTGRTAAWLRAHGVERIDGVDLTPEMLEMACERGAHDTLREGDVAETGLDSGASGEPLAIATHVHLLSDHVSAGLAAGWTLAEMREGVIDDRWIAVKPKWEKYRHHPISVAYAWRSPA